MKQIAITVAVVLVTHFNTFAGEAFTRAGEAFAINGKFYHNLELIAVKDGIAEFKSREGNVSVAWSSLPGPYQVRHAKEKADVEADAKARKPWKDHWAAGHKLVSGKVVRSNADGFLAYFRGDNPDEIFVLSKDKFADGEEIVFWAADAPLYEKGGRRLKCYRLIEISPD